MPWQTVLRTVKKAKERGWQAGSPLTDSMLNNAPRSGRPELLQPRDNNALEEVVDIHRTLPAHALVKVLEERFSELGLRKTPSRSTLLRWLKANGYRKVKFTTKPGLNQAQKMARLDFALQVRNWDLEKWKKVVWSDETSAVLGAYRGKRSIWRRPHESHSWRSIRRRWKGFSEFMFWGCFSYDRKGPGHCWIRETAALKKKYAGIISEYNAAHEAIDRATWESEERLTPSGKKSKKKWKYTAKTGKMEVKGKGGINWIRYQHEVLVPKFLPFVRKLGPGFIAQEDNAPAHASRWNQAFWKDLDIEVLNWPPNSPDLSAIEPPWFIIKVDTSRHGPVTSDAVLRVLWHRHWKEFPQARLQRFVRRIPGHIQWVLKLFGGNEYKEGTAPPDALTEAEIQERADFLMKWRAEEAQKACEKASQPRTRRTRAKEPVIEEADLAHEDPTEAADWVSDFDPE